MKRSNSYASMMVYDNNGIFVVFFINMGDIIVTRNAFDFIQDVITKLNTVFSLKDEIVHDLVHN